MIEKQKIGSGRCMCHSRFCTQFSHLAKVEHLVTLLKTFRIADLHRCIVINIEIFLIHNWVLIITDEELSERVIDRSFEIYEDLVCNTKV